jgi:hypothetical protein
LEDVLRLEPLTKVRSKAGVDEREEPIVVLGSKFIEGFSVAVLGPGNQ